MTQGHPFEQDTLEAFDKAQEAVEKYLRLAHRDRIADGYFGDATVWDEKEDMQSRIDQKIMTGVAFVGHFESMEGIGSVNICYGTPVRQSPALSKGLFGYAFEAYA
jgi:hypothetical protein